MVVEKPRVVGGGWQVQPASPSGVRAVLCGPVPGLRGPKCTAPGGDPGLRALPGREPCGAWPGLSFQPRAPPRCVGLGRHRQASALAPEARSGPSVRPSVRASVRRGPGEAQGSVRTAAAAREAEAPPQLPGLSLQFPPPGLGCGGEPPSLEGRILVWRCDAMLS